MEIAVLLNENPNSAENWLKAATEMGIALKSINLFSHKWQDEIKQSSAEIFLVCPSGVSSFLKRYFDERLEIISRVLDKQLYPGLLELQLHENKRYFYQWLEAKGVPHPKTWIFLDKEEVLRHVENSVLPVVAKMAIGASGYNVHVIKKKSKLNEYINRSFAGGIAPKSGPNLKMGNWRKRAQLVLKNPRHILDRLSIYKKIQSDLQRGYVILQEYVPHEFEWRVVRIGDSYFGHQKIKQGDKASGGKGINYVPPPESLLNFVSELCESNGFRSMAVDLFEDSRGNYLVNELQTVFGHVQDHICEVEGRPGRFIRKGAGWRFEEGRFNRNLSYNLRLEDAMKTMKRM